MLCIMRTGCLIGSCYATDFQPLTAINLPLKERQTWQGPLMVAVLMLVYHVILCKLFYT